MANTYAALFYHIVFSTKNRQRFIGKEIEERVWAYMAGVAKTHNLNPIQIGGDEDHVHALILARPRQSPSEIVKELKVGTSKWIHDEFPALRLFAW